MSELAMRVANVSYRYDSRPALDHISFELARGGFFALLGPNGAGKTTLFALLTRLLHTAEGDIEIFGVALEKSPGRALSKMGVVFQQSTLDLDLTVAQNLAYHGALQGMSPREVRKRMDTELGRFDLTGRKDDKVRILNGGHRRRVEIARALLHQPQLLLLDEPTVGLDVETRHSLKQHVRTLCEDSNIAVLWTTHLIEEVQASDQVLILHNGTTCAKGRCAELLSQYNAADLPSLFVQLTSTSV